MTAVIPSRTLHYLLTLALYALVFLVDTRTGTGQILNAATQNTPAVPVPGSSFVGTLNETVNPADGSLTIRLPIPTAHGRGPYLPFSIIYSSNQVNHLEVTDVSAQCAINDLNCVNSPSTSVTEQWLSNPSSLSIDGWSYSVPMVSSVVKENYENPGTVSGGTVTAQTVGCYWWADYIFQDNEGSAHALALSSPVPISAGQKAACSYTPSSHNSGGDDFYQSQVTSASTSSDIPPSISIVDADGTVYKAGGLTQNYVYNGNSAHSFSGLIYSIEDRNGNQLTINDQSLTNTALQGHFTVVDSAQRTILSSDGFGTSGTHIATSVLANPYTLTWTTTTSNYQVPDKLQYGGNLCNISILAVNRATKGISVVALPNSTNYGISYDSTYGLVDKIVFPNGGYVRYQWAMSPLLLGAYYPAGCYEEYGTPVVQNRFVSFDGVNEVEEDDFSYSTAFASGAAGWNSRQTTVTVKDLVSKTSYQVIHNFSPITTPSNDMNGSQSPGPPSSMVENANSTYDTTGTLIQTVQQTWGDQYLVSTQKTTLPGSGTSEVDSFYGYPIQSGEPVSNTPGLLVEKDEYDFGNPSSSGSPNKKTVMTPQGFGILPTYPGFQAILDRPANIKIYQGSTLLAETDYAYGTSVTAVTNATGHDETNYGSTLSPARGNATTITRQCSPNCANAITSLTYDETGQTTSATDPNNNLTQYSYADSYVSGAPSGVATNAYLTTITYPNTGVPHAESFTYNYESGLLASKTDQNHLTTNYSYVDPLSRITLEQGPPDPNNGGQSSSIQTAYDDVTPSITRTTTLNTSGVKKVMMTTMDHMGHVIHSQLTSDPNGTDTTDTTYDGLGRVASISNPYRSTSDASYGITSYSYDALNRKLLQCNPDNTTTPSTSCSAGSSYKQWVYSGATTDFYDEQGHHWEQTQDSFGRLSKVMEPDPKSNALALETDYTYSALDDLITVNQWGGTSGAAGVRTRSFTYDSFSRLTTAANPETGTICYGQWNASNCVNGYDMNGNLLAKTDARGVTTSYQYDALNRLLSKTYNVGTASSCYQYDQSSLASSGANLVGRLANSWTQAAACPASTSSPSFLLPGILSRRSILAYDVMGRPLSEQQCRFTTCASGTSYSPTYTYDLAGDLVNQSTGLSSGAGSFVLTHSYDAAGRLCSLTSGTSSLFATAQSSASTGCALTSTTAFGYTPWGALWNAALGTGSLQLTRSYDNRLRIISETDTGNVISHQTPGAATITITGTDVAH